MFDSHCHPTDIEDPFQVVTSALHAGLHSMLACGYNRESNRAVLELREHFPSLPISLGIHPWFADESVDTLPELVERMHPTAIGECGLDFAPEDSIPSREVQIRAFEAQLDLAQTTGKPVTVHSRRAVPQVFELICAFPRAVGILHAFGGSCEQALGFVEKGWLIGIGGAVTRPSARRIHKLAQRLPIQAIALETDAPAIGLEGVYPPNVRPAHLVQVARTLAELRKQCECDVVEATDRNVARVLGPETLARIPLDSNR